jgi:hypothetical protein
MNSNDDGANDCQAEMSSFADISACGKTGRIPDLKRWIPKKIFSN